MEAVDPAQFTLEIHVAASNLFVLQVWLYLYTCKNFLYSHNLDVIVTVLLKVTLALSL